MYRYTDVWPYKVTSNLWTVFYFRLYTILLCSRDLIFAIHDLVAFNILWTFCLFWFSFCCIPLVILYYFVWWFVTVVWFFRGSIFPPTPTTPTPLHLGSGARCDSLVKYYFWLVFWYGVKVNTSCLLLFINLHNLILDG